MRLDGWSSWLSCWSGWVFPGVTSSAVRRGVTLLIYSGYITIVFDFVCWNSDFTSVFVNFYACWSVSINLPLVITAFLDSDGLRGVFTFWRISDFQSISTVCWCYVNGTIILRLDGWSSWLSCWSGWVFPGVTSSAVRRGVTLLIYSGYITIVFDFVCWNSDFTSVFVNGYAFWSVVTLLPLAVSVFLDSEVGWGGVFTFWRISDYQSISTVCWRYVNRTIVLRLDLWSSWLSFWSSWVVFGFTSGFVGRVVTLLIYSGYITTVFDFLCWNSDFTSVFVNGYAFWSCTSPVSIIAFRDSEGLLAGFTFWRISDYQSISILCWSDRG